VREAIGDQVVNSDRRRPTLSDLENEEPSARPGDVDRSAQLDRREFLAITALAAAGLTAAPSTAIASDFADLIPPNKRLKPEWVASLAARGTPAVYRNAELEMIGMPIGGLCAGQLYLGGDGTIWRWDLFNELIESSCSGDAYRTPYKPVSPIDHGFAIQIALPETTLARRLDARGFANVSFRGEYPIGRVEYRDASLPVAVDLEAFSPFIPLDTKESSSPVTVLRYTVKNTGGATIRATLAAWLENGVCLNSASNAPVVRRNRIIRGPALTFLECGADALPPQNAPARQPIVFMNFDGKDYAGWTTAGEAFGARPAVGGLASYQTLRGFRGAGLVNTYFNSSDAPTGKLTSPTFKIERKFISFLIGGGNHPGETCVNLLVDGKIVRSETAKNDDALFWANWIVSDLEGKNARIEIVDAHSGGWGHIDVDEIEFRDTPRAEQTKLEDRPDFGTMGLALLGHEPGDRASARIGEGERPATAFDGLEPAVAASAQAPSSEQLRGALGRELVLEPGQSASVTFLLAWHFPNLHLPGLGEPQGVGRHYATRFTDAAAVANHVTARFDELARTTKLWSETWYDSTLPYWFLDRTFLNTSTLATSTSHRFRNGRFYGWEGVGSCPGTCTHVWQYAQAVGRLFPELERIARENVDYADSVGFDSRSGVIDHRAEFHVGPAVDGQAGTILRVYREHQMSANDAFLRRIWPKVKSSIAYLMDQHDADSDGILSGSQHNTLDAAWFGEIAWLSILYLAAVRAGGEMAREMGDPAFARRCKAIADRGKRRVVERLWNGEYFVMNPDPKHPDSPGTFSGCHIDQVFGQSWAFQVGLDRVIPEANCRQALQAIWKFNFTPDVGPYRARYKNGRWYALAGEAGTIMCTFPRGGDEALSKGNQGFAGYLNECMAGFEYQVAAHMIWERMVTEGLALTRVIHDRYHPSKRNPYNEIECGDHYARSMASYGVYLAACGFEFHGPKGHIGFAPRLSPEDFRAAFTAAEGWGSYAQTRNNGRLTATIRPRYGQLNLKTIALEVPEGTKAAAIEVTIDGRSQNASPAQAGGRVTITFPALVHIATDQSLQVLVKLDPAASK
jgi:non-lysosomal glucosylceramidase